MIPRRIGAPIHDPSVRTDVLSQPGIACFFLSRIDRRDARGVS